MIFDFKRHLFAHVFQQAYNLSVPELRCSYSIDCSNIVADLQLIAPVMLIGQS